MEKNTFFLTGLKSECLSISKNIHENTINVSTILEHCESIISDTINQQMDKNMQRAEKKRNSWSKTSNNFAIKCLYSTGEWSRYFNKKTGVYALNELRRAIALLKELQGKIGIIRNFAEIISSSAFIVMNFSDQKRAIHQYWSRHDQSKEKLMRDIQNFQELINILDRFCEFVPPEIKSYL